jgi:imidazolonepropionase-like amidohydrolase
MLSVHRVVVSGLVFSVVSACGAGRPDSERPRKVERATLAITNVRVFDGERVIPRADVLVDGGTIVAVGAGLEVPAGTEAIDGTGKTVLPGLIDSHVHVFYGAQLEEALAFGVTTVLDMFSVPSSTRPLRSENQPGRADLRSAGILATAPGGHGTQYGITIPTLTRPDEAQAFVDARLAEGSDYLKIVFDDGSAYGRPLPTVDAPTLRALIEAAHARNKLAVVHIGTFAEARTAIESGADGLVHLFRDRAPDPGFGALAAKHKAFVTPTLTVLRTLQGETSSIGDDPALAPLLGAEAKANLKASFRLRARGGPDVIHGAVAQLVAANVPILVGTDAPNPGTTFGASVHDELALLVAAGVPATTALAGATSLPAARYALDDRGRIATGRRADLVLVDGDPTTQITDTRRIVAVWRGGTRFDRAAFQARIAKAEQDVAAGSSTPGLLSDFEDGTLSVRFGQPWIVSTDSFIGGSSRAELAVVDGGAAPGRKALAITGEVVAHAPTSWAGALFSPGTRPFSPADLSKQSLRFMASGEGKTYVVMVFAQSRGRVPAIRTFQAGKDFAPVRFTWSDFDGLTGNDIMGIFIGKMEPGPFRLVIDQVALE